MAILKGKDSQIASIDIILASMMFMMISAVIVIYIFSSVMGDTSDELDSEARILLSTLTAASEDMTSYTISEGNSINRFRYDSLLERLLFEDSFYNDMKEDLGLSHEFCIHLEDDEGNLIYPHELLEEGDVFSQIFDEEATPEDDPEEVTEVFAIGSDTISVGGEPCISYDSLNETDMLIE